MCGIIGYIGKNNPKEVLLEGLKKLEYRGYDSAGIALKNEEEIQIIKSLGKISDLEQKVFNENSNKILDDVKLLKGKRGRSSYLDGKEIGFDEPGCVLVNMWLDYILNNKL